MKQLEGQIRIPSGCAISAVISKEGKRMTGEKIVVSMKPMHDRSNGLGGGFAGYGIYPDFKDFFALHIYPRIHIEGNEQISFAVSCRHCRDPLCVKSCIAGALSQTDGLIRIDRNKCVGCQTCILVCPYGALALGGDGIMQKCELCVSNACGEPACVAGCPNKAIVYEER